MEDAVEDNVVVLPAEDVVVYILLIWACSPDAAPSPAVIAPQADMAAIAAMIPPGTKNISPVQKWPELIKAPPIAAAAAAATAAAILSPIAQGPFANRATNKRTMAPNRSPVAISIMVWVPLSVAPAGLPAVGSDRAPPPPPIGDPGAEPALPQELDAAGCAPGLELPSPAPVRATPPPTVVGRAAP